MPIEGRMRIVPKLKSEGIEGYGTIEYVDLPQGYIKIKNDFFKKWMVKVELPFVGWRRIHKAMKEPLLKVLNHIVHVSQYDSTWEYIEHLSCYNPRHMWRKRNKPLSMHAYGLAVDVNPWENLPGTEGVIPTHIVGCFKSNGFDWGGDFRYTDPMHFEIHIEDKS